MLENQLPLFGKSIQCVYNALADVLENHLDEEDDYDSIWLIYKKNLEGVKQLLTPNYAEEKKNPLQGTTEDWNVPQKPGFKLFLKPDGTAYGRIDFDIPINKLPDIFKLVSKIQKSIEEFCDSETD
jgi:hypothetical protein